VLVAKSVHLMCLAAKEIIYRTEIYNSASVFK
jgi:hypothetical protein